MDLHTRFLLIYIQHYTRGCFFSFSPPQLQQSGMRTGVFTPGLCSLMCLRVSWECSALHGPGRCRGLAMRAREASCTPWKRRAPSKYHPKRERRYFGGQKESRSFEVGWGRGVLLMAEPRGEAASPHPPSPLCLSHHPQPNTRTSSSPKSLLSTCPAHQQP